MKIENKLTIAHLKQNKRRTIITILGIVLSVAMFTAVVSAGASFLDLLGNYAVSQNGDYHFFVRSGNERTVNVIKSNENVDDYCFEYTLPNEQKSYYIEDGVAKYSSIGDWKLGDDKFFEWMVTKEYEGTLPSNPKEIALTRGVIEENNLDWKIGDTVTIATVFRYLGDEIFQVPAVGGYESGQKLEIKGRDEYKITAIINSEKTGTDIYRYPTEQERKNAFTYVKLKKLSPLALSQIYDIFRELKIDLKEYYQSATINHMAMVSCLSFDAKDTTEIGIVAVFAGLLIIIMLCAVILIYNAFSMSYAEKVRYLGMLSSVGATRVQKLKSTYFEAIVLGGIGIPIGFLVGLGLNKIITLTLGGLALTAGVLDGAEDMAFRLVMPWWASAIILLLSVITIFISVYRPAINASFITPIDAIRQSKELKAKASRSPKLIKKLFGYEGVLAYKNQKRNGRKGRLVTASIALSIVLLLVCNYACDISMQSSGITTEAKHQIEIYNVMDKELVEKCFAEIDEIDRFYNTDCEWIHINDVDLDAEESDGFFTAEQSAINSETLTSTYSILLENQFTFFFNFITDKDFDDFCAKNGIDPKPYYELDGKFMKCVVMNNINHKKDGARVFTDKLLGQCLYENFNENSMPDEVVSEEQIEEVENTRFRYKFCDFADYDKDDYMCNLNFTNSVSCFIPQSTLDKYVAECSVYDGFPHSYGIETKDHKTVARKLRNYLEDFGSYDGINSGYYNVLDREAEFAMAKAVVTIAKTLVYSFILLIILIIAVNIVNTISTSIALREKEFAMLKSVGLTPKGFKKMIAFESIFNALRAIIIALPLSFGTNYALTKILGDGKIPFTINLPLTIITCASAFAIVLASMLLGMKTSGEASVADTLKTDIS